MAFYFCHFGTHYLSTYIILLLVCFGFPLIFISHQQLHNYHILFVILTLTMDLYTSLIHHNVIILSLRTSGNIDTKVKEQ